MRLSLLELSMTQCQQTLHLMLLLHPSSKAMVLLVVMLKMHLSDWGLLAYMNKLKLRKQISYWIKTANTSFI
ncbi:hypothetical protein EDC96DRAFT_523495 [Choanephora cucurbitarum]|nr:hypothetical protein EDC96DRAFT_523495 [Choanephora cucurbitarum]